MRLFSGCPTGQLSVPAAVSASPPSGSGWCATPARRSSSVGYTAGRAWGRILWQRESARQSQGRFIIMLIITDGCYEKFDDEKDISFTYS